MALRTSVNFPRGENKNFSKPSFMMLTVSRPAYLWCFMPFFCSGKSDVAGPF